MKEDKDNDTTRSGLGFCGALTIAFIVLKLCKIINWSWIWVLSPLWIPAAIAVILVTIILIALVIRRVIRKMGEDDNNAGQ